MTKLLLLLLYLPPARATPLESYWRNAEGVARFAQKSYYAAYQRFLKALEPDPFNPEILMNLALTFEVNEEYEKAEKAYASVLHLLPETAPLRFAALFNIGGVQAKQKKIDEALKSYQAALAMDPNSKEVKTNIELLWQQGGGGGKGKDKDQKKDPNGKEPQEKPDGDKPQNKDGPIQNGKPSEPKPFDSKELTPQDVKKILDEIKNQEQSVRANEYEKGVKEAPRGKDW